MSENPIPGPPVEAELRRSEERFRVLSSVATEGIMIHADQIVLDANQAFVDLLGLSSPQELIGRNGMDLIRFTPDSRARVLKHLQSGSRKTYDIQIIKPDGTVVSAETHGRDIEYLGRPARLVYMRDISARKRADEALRESERNYREIFNATNDALFIHDESGRIVDVNERMCAMFKCDRESALRYSAADLSLGESPFGETEAVARLQQAAERGSQTFVWCSRRADGELFWSEVALRPFLVAGKKRVIASVRDISERKEAEDALANEKRFAETVFESLPGMAYVYNEDGYLVRWNRNYEKALGRSHDELSRGNLHFSETVCDADRERVRQAVADVFTQVPVEIEFGLQSTTGVITPYFATGRVADLGGERYLVGVGFDISERVASEAEKGQLQQQLNHAAKMEAVGQLAGGVAHEFNNLLTVIAGNIELARAESVLHDDHLPYLDQVQRAATSAAELTRQLLAFSRRQIIEPQVSNLNEIVVTVQTMLKRLIGENIEIRTLLAEDLAQVNVDRTQFEQILVNLAVNARDAMPDGGQLVIATTNIELSDDGNLLAGLTPGPHVLLTVTDSGHGISDELIQHVFEPFFTTKTKGKGTGLGLATIFGSVKQAGGAIDVQSEVGQGARFRIFLPRHEGRAEVSPPTKAPEMHRGAETVLLVEDDQSVRELVEAFLQRLGYDVLPTASGEEAIALIQQQIRRIDLLLTDMVMPGLSGRETSDKLKELLPDLKVLYMSGYTDDSVARRHVLDENLDFIAKPFDLKSLATKLHEILDRKTD